MSDRMRNTTSLVLAAIFFVAAVFVLRAAPQAGASPQVAVPGPPAGGVDPAKLPDIEGIRLTMPTQDAMSKLSALFPGKVEVRYSKFQGPPDKPWVSMLIGGGMQVSGCKSPCGDTVNVWFSTPPAKPEVVSVERQLVFEIGKMPPVLDQVATLRQKFGQQMPATVNPTYNPLVISWTFDEEGKLLPASTPHYQPNCAGTLAEPGGGVPKPGNPYEIPWLIPLYTGTAAQLQDYMSNPCRYHVNVMATIIPYPGPNPMVQAFNLQITENAEDTRNAIAAQNYLNSQAKKP
jgi:hypothetical protein